MTSSGIDWTQFGLWFALIASGVYHGVNPGMGWPLAVSAGMMERSPHAFWSALGSLAAGHLLAILVATLPFALLTTLLFWQREIQICTSALIIGFGLFLLIAPRHPRALARIRPTQLGLWSFAVAIAHGAGLMLVPIYLGICRSGESARGQLAAGALTSANIGIALLVAFVHTLAMVLAGGTLAWLVYRYWGLRVISRSWLNFDGIWAVSFILIGAISLALNVVGIH